MARRPVFLSEHVPGIRGLTALTEPGDDERVDAIVDVAVIGARGDGKTQFIVHAIRTLRAYGPALLGAEQQYHRDVMRVVLDARAPRPEATPPGVVPHYVFRIRPAALLAGLGAMAKVELLGATQGLRLLGAAALGAGALVGAGAAGLGGAIDLAALGGAAVASGGGALGLRAAGGRFVRGGEIEVVFWDVAGEHVYSRDCADYHAFLDALVRERRARAGARRYAFAPVLLCNPLGLGVEREGSAYARLRQVVPLFASLDAATRVLVAVNRWSLVEALCAPDAERDEVVSVIERRRGEAASELAPPSVRRDVVRAWCRDAEDGRDDDVLVTHLRYDAATRCEVTPVEGGVEYRWEEGPGAFAGAARRVFLGWLADLAYRAARATVSEIAPEISAPVLTAPPLPALAPLGQQASPEVWARRTEG